VKAAESIEAARAQAARIAARAQLRDVRALSLEAKLHRDPVVARGLSYHLTSSGAVQAEDQDFVVRFTYNVAITEEPSDEEEAESEGNTEEQAAATIDFELAALFSLDMGKDEEPPSQPELEAYAQSTGYFALYPFARELIYDITGRLALPPLTIGVDFIPVDRE
jgi:preprotein translocase subunit SecB